MGAFPFPHYYKVSAHAQSEGEVTLAEEGVPTLRSSPPRQFGGSGEQWSPESLFMAAVADCFVLTFRAVAKASKLSWRSLSCVAVGTLDRVDRVTRFTEISVEAALQIPRLGDGRDLEQKEQAIERAERLLEKSEKGCLVTNSLTCVVNFSKTVESN